MWVEERKSTKKNKNGKLPDKPKKTYSINFYYIDEYGHKRKYKKSGFESIKKAKEHGALMYAQIQKDGYLKKGCTKTLCDCYLEYIDLKKDKISLNTLIGYDSCYKNHIKNLKLANIPVDKLNYQMLQKYFNSISDLGECTQKRIKLLMKLATKHAIKCGYTSNNYIDLVELNYTKSKKEKTIISEDELEYIIERLISHCGHIYQFESYSQAVAIYIGYYTGLRISEILALEKSDFDLSEKNLYISKRIELVTKQKKKLKVTNRLKTKASYSVLPMPDKLVDILKKWFEFNPFDIVCASSDGSYILANTIRYKLKKFGKEIGKDITTHCLRHTFISNVVTSNIDLKTAQELARHANIDTTLNVYTHTDEDKKKDAIDKVFKKPQNNSQNNNSFLN